jgi:ABC-type glycerol-3-phosphate transport system substrate-binding protein
VTTDSDPVVEATRMVRTFIDGDAPNALDSVAGDIAPRTILQWQEETSRTPFANGNAVMHRNWPYAINIAGAEDAYGEDLGVMPIPYGVEESEAEFEGYGGTVSALGGWHVALNPNSEKQEIALEVIEAMASEEFYIFLFEEVGWLPPVKKMFESEQAKNVPVMGRYLDTLQVAVENAIPRPVTVAWPQESPKISQNANSAFSGDGTPKQAMQTLARQLEQIEEASSREKTGSTESDSETSSGSNSNETSGSTPTEQPTRTGGD